MRKLTAFENVSLDGFFTDASNDMSWAHAGSDDPEFAAFTAGNAKGGGTLVFGRVTYDMMAGYWPSPMAKQQNAVVAERMNAMAKIVLSRAMDKAAWSNTTVVKSIADLGKLKQEAGDDMVILGSGRIVAQAAAAGLLDAIQTVVNPIALGKGRSLFDGRLTLKLTDSRAFKNGKVFLSYALQ